MRSLHRLRPDREAKGAKRNKKILRRRRWQEALRGRSAGINSGAKGPEPALSPRNVRLLQGAELVAAQRLVGQVVVLHAEREDGLASGLGDEGIELIDVQLSLQQRRHEPRQFGGTGLDRQYSALVEREALAHQ